MRKSNSFPLFMFAVVAGIGAALAWFAYRAAYDAAAIAISCIAVVLAFLVSASIQVADQLSRAVVLRLEKFRSLEGQGLFMIVPLVENIPYWIDTRVLTSSLTMGIGQENANKAQTERNGRSVASPVHEDELQPA